MSITRDVSGEGVQQGLLKMIEGTVMRLPSSDKRKNPKGDMLEMDTTSILFICGGAFVGLDKIIQKRKDANSIGFNSKLVSNTESSVYYNQVTTKDLITYGMIPEFIGRFGIITNVEELKTEQLVQILKEPKNSLVRQYQYLFEIDEIELDFDEDAFEQIAIKSKELKTNARGLKNILEKVLLPYQFDSINLVERGLTKIIISKESVDGSPAKLVFNKKNDKKST
jgi:ATP-dependent Clp protease ATP-binding subunit ClpX